MKEDNGVSASPTGPAPQGAEPQASQAKPLVPDAYDWLSEILIHMQPSQPPCDHEFSGWRDHSDGLGGEQFCQKCGLGAMAHTLSLDWD